jgi:hypothetical protein
MRDHLLDIVQHTHGLGVLNLIKITGDQTSTTINAFDQDNRTVILNAEFKAPVADFVGTFGMPNLDRLNTILNLPVYKEDAKITVTQQDGEPSGITFVNKDGDFKNNYRFMGSAIINDQLKSVSMKKQVKWGVEITPTVVSIQKLKFQAQAHSDATFFSTKVDNGDLKFYFGDHSSHAGDFTFAQGCGGALTKQLYWPVNVVISILSLPGDKTFKISDENVAEITVDSGIAVYRYILPSQTK